MFPTQVMFTSHRVLVQGAPGHTVTDDPYDFIYRNLPQRRRLRNVPECHYCGAMRFQYKTPRFCCRKGKIKIHIREVSAKLKRLFTSQVHDDAKYFRQHIRYLNSHFAFASPGVTFDRRYNTPVGSGIYTFRVYSGLYHCLDHLVLGDHDAWHLQLYFYDTEDEALSHRVKRSTHLDINLIRNILTTMRIPRALLRVWRRNINMASL
jgi:hypothetical protein